MSTQPSPQVSTQSPRLQVAKAIVKGLFRPIHRPTFTLAGHNPELMFQETYGPRFCGDCMMTSWHLWAFSPCYLPHAIELLHTFRGQHILGSTRQALAMRWPSFWSSPKNERSNHDSSAQSPGEVLDSLLDTARPSNSTPTTSTSLDTSGWKWRSYTEPQTIFATITLTSACIGFYRFYRTFLRRIPAVGNISPNFFRKRSVFGQVTSVGDGDNFRIFHTPGGLLAGWGWWRSIPADKKALKNNTVCGRNLCNVTD